MPHDAARCRTMTMQLLPAAMLVATLVLGAPTVTDTPAPTVTDTPTSVVTTEDDVDARRRCVWTGYRWRCWERVWGTAGTE
jgi:hypothetical protein